ncbi:TenA family protein [Actinokineospora sp. 24-640]
MTFLDDCDQRVADLWRAYRRHPWIEALAAGVLEPRKFAFFQLDDGAHVAEFNRTLALGVAKAPTGHEWAAAAAHVLDDMSTVAELEEKRSLVAELGFDAPPEPDRLLASPAREGYVNHLVRTGYEGTFPQIATALLPCAMFVEVIGARFRGVELVGPTAYRRWADMYTRRTRSQMCAAHRAVVTEEAGRTDDAGREHLFRIYRRSLEHQVRVFDAAWSLEGAWPGGHRCHADQVVGGARPVEARTAV